MERASHACNNAPQLSGTTVQAAMELVRFTRMQKMCLYEWLNAIAGMAVAHQLGTGGEEASHARLHTVKHVPQIRPPPRLRQLNAGLAYTMASPGPLTGAIQPGCSACTV